MVRENLKLVSPQSIFIQIVGGVMSTSNNNSTLSTAETILKVGYIIQVAGLLFFIGLAYSSGPFRRSVPLKRL